MLIFLVFYAVSFQINKAILILSIYGALYGLSQFLNFLLLLKFERGENHRRRRPEAGIRYSGHAGTSESFFRFQVVIILLAD